MSARPDKFDDSIFLAARRRLISKQEANVVCQDLGHRCPRRVARNTFEIQNLVERVNGVHSTSLSARTVRRDSALFVDRCRSVTKESRSTPSSGNARRVPALTLPANSGNAGPPISRVILHPHRMHSTEAGSQRSSAVGGGDSLRPRIQRTMATMTRATVPTAPTAVRLLPGPWLGPSIASRKKILPVAVSTRLKQSQKRRYSAKKPFRLFSVPPIVRSPALMNHLRTPLRSTGSSALACSNGYRVTGSPRARMGL